MKKMQLLLFGLMTLAFGGVELSAGWPRNEQERRCIWDGLRVIFPAGKNRPEEEREANRDKRQRVMIAFDWAHRVEAFFAKDPNADDVDKAVNAAVNLMAFWNSGGPELVKKIYRGFTAVGIGYVEIFVSSGILAPDVSDFLKPLNAAVLVLRSATIKLYGLKEVKVESIGREQHVDAPVFQFSQRFFDAMNPGQADF